MSTAPILEVATRQGARLKRVTAVEWAGPCPRCGGRDRFGVNVARGLFDCRGCGGRGDAITLVRHVAGMTYAEALAFVGDERANARAPRPPSEARQQPAPSEPADAALDVEKAAYALALWREAVDPRGTLVEAYLASRRLTLDPDIAGSVLRWHPCERAMLALFRNVKTGERQAVSRTFLDANGKKLGRKFLGPVGGAAIMFEPFDAVTMGLHIGEGIETVMSVRALNLKPPWALGSKGAIARFPVLAGVEALTILEEPDAAAEARQCAQRLHAAGAEVYFNRAIGRKDLNDLPEGIP